MSEKIIPFIPAGGEQSRIERQWDAARFENDTETEFEFRSIDELPVESLVARWNELIQSFALPRPAGGMAMPEHDGVAALDDAPPEQVRQSLAYHYKQIHDEYSTLEDRRYYWDIHPEIQLYLDHSVRQMK